ncbi:synaptotagmin 7f [Helobdella robusta]|uniref:Synaptotagmin 7f n=1 Tax=Helobdella robusta TaxID=6412 RepID=T1ELL3_HELRO|nr:synaptotagmin 7f [Helobdella robusta]ESO06483.1 synaptotagmin 7f [Helobdella robusta]
MVLTLKIIQASELVAKDFSGTSDPYVKILLLPDKRNKLTTKVKRKNLNPKWNETFLFEGFPYTKLLNRTLYLQVLDYDRFSRDDPIGEVSLPLCELQLSTTGQIIKMEANENIFYFLILLRMSSLTLFKWARNLKAKDINGQSDPYVKIWLMFDGKRIEKRKTGIKEKCLNPTFDEEFPFLVPYEKIRQTSLFISVMDYDRMGRNELIGQVLLGSKSGPMEIKHWNEMFSKSKTDVKKWHMLKSFS